MRHCATPEDGLRRRRILVAVVTLVGLLFTAGVYAALTQRHTSSPVDRDSSSAVVRAPEPAPAPAVAPVDGVLPELAPTADPETFARLVAQAIFDWDTTLVAPLAGYTSRLVAVADPSGESSPGLVADLATYLPTATAWDRLRTYSTRQWLRITSVEVPSLWPQAQKQAGSSLLPATTAYTITGIPQRAGVWEGKPVASEHTVAFTVFMVCAPSYPGCHLLRLSRLDEPLD